MELLGCGGLALGGRALLRRRREGAIELEGVHAEGSEDFALAE